MIRFIKPYRRRIFVFGMVVISLWILLFSFTSTSFAQPTIPVLVDYFDTGTFNSFHPDDIVYNSATGNLAIVDNVEDKVYIVDPSGDKLSEINTVAFGSSRPRGITFISSSGNYAIVDDLADEVFIINSSGTLQGQFDTAAFGATNPQGIAYIPATGNFAIIDEYADEVFIVNSSGTLQGQFDTAALGSISPKGITYISATGNLAIVDWSSDEVYIVNSAGVQQDHFDTGFVSGGATGITFDSQNGIFRIIDQTAAEVFTLNAEGHILDQFSTLNFGSTSPVGITHISGTDNFAIVDDADDDVYIVNSAGEYQNQCDISVFSNFPTGIAYIPPTSNGAIVGPPINADLSSGGFAIVEAQADELFIVDTGCNLIGRYDVATFGINSVSPSGIECLSADDFVITDDSRDSSLFFNINRPGRIQSQFGTVIFGFSMPRGIAYIPATASFAIVGNNFDEVIIATSGGALKARFDTALFSLNPQGIAFDADHNIFAVVDSADDEVTLLDLPCLTRSQSSETVSTGGPVYPTGLPQAINVHNKNIHIKERRNF